MPVTAHTSATASTCACTQCRAEAAAKVAAWWATPPAPADNVAWDRAETDSCERGTPGCCIRHTDDTDCETW